VYFEELDLDHLCSSKSKEKKISTQNLGLYFFGEELIPIDWPTKPCLPRCITSVIDWGTKTLAFEISSLTKLERLSFSYHHYLGP